MTKPSREDFERALSSLDNRYGPRIEPIIREALRIAAEQVGEREKVVTWHRERGARARKNFDDRTYIFHDMCADAIERGEHSTATPVSGWRSMDSAPRDGSEFMASIENDHSPGTLFWEPRCRFNPEAERFEIWGRTDYDQDGWEFYPSLTFRSWMPQPLPSPPGGGT